MSKQSESYADLVNQSNELADKAAGLRREAIEDIKQRIADMNIMAEEIGFATPKKKKGAASGTPRRGRKNASGAESKGPQPSGDGTSSSLQ